MRDPRPVLFRHLGSVIPDAARIFRCPASVPFVKQCEWCLDQCLDDTALYAEAQDLRTVPGSYRRLVQRLLYIEAHPPPELFAVAFEWRSFFLSILSFASVPLYFAPTVPIPLSHVLDASVLDPSVVGHFARYRNSFVCNQPGRTTANDSDPLYTLLRRVWPHQCQLKHFRRRLMSLFHRHDPASQSATDFVCRAQILFALGMYRTAFAFPSSSKTEEKTDTTHRNPNPNPNPNGVVDPRPPLPDLAALAAWTRAWVSPDRASDLHALALRREPHDFMDWILALRELMAFLIEADTPFASWLRTHSEWDRYAQVIQTQCRQWRAHPAPASIPASVPADQRCVVTMAGDFWTTVLRCFPSTKVPKPREQPFWIYQMARLERYAWRLAPLVYDAHRYTETALRSAADADDDAEFRNAIPSAWIIPSAILAHEQGRYLRNAHILYCVFDQLGSAYFRPGILNLLLPLLQVHCGPRLSDTARHNRYVTCLTALAKSDALAYSVFYSLCVGVQQAQRVTVSFWPRSIVDRQYSRLYQRAGCHESILIEASHLYVCPCCMEIHSMVQKSSVRRSAALDPNQPPRAYTSSSVSGMQRTCIDLLNHSLYCARKNGKKAARCHRTALVAFPLLGVLLGYYGKFYTVCVSCGIQCEFTGSQMSALGPRCTECTKKK